MTGRTTFIQKLYAILQDTQYQNIIQWSPTGNSFIIINFPKFRDILLPTIFKHSNYPSFVRQLNLYGFTKLNRSYHRNVEGINNQEEKDKEPKEYHHPLFSKGNVKSLEGIKRKVPHSTFLHCSTNSSNKRKLDYENSSSSGEEEEEYSSEGIFSNSSERTCVESPTHASPTSYSIEYPHRSPHFELEYYKNKCAYLENQLRLYMQPRPEYFTKPTPINTNNLTQNHPQPNSAPVYQSVIGTPVYKSVVQTRNDNSLRMSEDGNGRAVVFAEGEVAKARDT